MAARSPVDRAAPMVFPVGYTVEPASPLSQFYLTETRQRLLYPSPLNTQRARARVRKHLAARY